MKVTVRAAGAIVWRVRGRRLQVLLVHRPGYDDWSWPKGKPKRGEALPVTAVREVEEEAGLRVCLGQALPSVRYPVNGSKKLKESYYWAATVTTRGSWTKARRRVRRARSREVDDTRWVDARKALKILTYEHDRVPLEHLMDQWEDDKLDTWTVVIVRHSRARKRSAWAGGEETRPLTHIGELQSRHLVPILSAFGVNEVITSPWERCAATVRPYLDATGITPDVRDSLTEWAAKESPKEVRRVVDAELRSAESAVAICTHRPVLPTVISQLTVHTPNRIKKRMPASDPWLKTGEILVAHLAAHRKKGGVVVALEKHRPYSLGGSSS